MADSSTAALVPSVAKTNGILVTVSASETMDAGGGTLIGALEVTAAQGGAPGNEVPVPSKSNTEAEVEEHPSLTLSTKSLFKCRRFDKAFSRAAVRKSITAPFKSAITDVVVRLLDPSNNCMI